VTNPEPLPEECDWERSAEVSSTDYEHYLDDRFERLVSRVI
jgi:hypothetical protein